MFIRDGISVLEVNSQKLQVLLRDEETCITVHLQFVGGNLQEVRRYRESLGRDESILWLPPLRYRKVCATAFAILRNTHQNPEQHAQLALALKP